jgi:hypothetical protein
LPLSLSHRTIHRETMILFVTCIASCQNLDGFPPTLWHHFNSTSPQSHPP